MADIAKANVDDFKSLVGKVVYLLPTGNNLNRAVNKQEAVPAEITKVGRVNVSFVIAGLRTEDTYRIANYERYRLTSGHNSGYIVFETKSAVDDYQKANDIRRKLRDFFSSYGSRVESLSLQQLEQINDIIGGLSAYDN